MYIVGSSGKLPWFFDFVINKMWKINVVKNKKKEIDMVLY